MDLGSHRLSRLVLLLLGLGLDVASAGNAEEDGEEEVPEAGHNHADNFSRHILLGIVLRQ